MLKQILAITGKPGLFKIISHGARSLVVEDITTKRRFPASSRDKVVSLGDIAMYTESGDTPLGEILDKVYAHYDGKTVDVKDFVKNGRLRDEFEAVVADYDRDRVYDNDIKKLFTWYNLLLEAGYTKFAEEEENMETAADEAQAVAAEEGEM